MFRLTVAGYVSSTSAYNWTFRLRKGNYSGTPLISFSDSIGTSGKIRIVFEFGRLTSTTSVATYTFNNSDGTSDVDVLAAISHGSSDGLTLTVQSDYYSSSFTLTHANLEMLDA